MSFRAEHLVPAPPEAVWAWHNRPGAVTRLTPPFLPMSPLEEASNLRDGVTLFRLPGGLKWRAEHNPDAFAEGHRFQDVCTNQPLAAATRWRHTHSFIGHPAGTIVADHVRSTVPASFLRDAFAYRQRQLIHDIAHQRRMQAIAPDLSPSHGGRALTIAVTGSHGGVGSQLCAQLTTAGHQVIRLVRRRPGVRERQWNPAAPDADLLAGVDAVVHLAGAPIFGPFTRAHKRKIYGSRVKPTEKLAQLAAATPSVRTFVSASAIGFYGADRGSEELTETSPQGTGFLAKVVGDWEAAAQSAAANGTTRVVNVRTGICLAGDSGLLPLLRAAFSTGLGDPFGKGDFWFSWISRDDLTDIYFRALIDESLTGPINATAPQPVRNRDMAHLLGKTLHRPTVVRLPRWAPALLLGKEGAHELALADQRVLPYTLTSHRHAFRYEDLSAALRHELGGEPLWGPRHSG